MKRAAIEKGVENIKNKIQSKNKRTKYQNYKLERVGFRFERNRGTENDEWRQEHRKDKRDVTIIRPQNGSRILAARSVLRQEILSKKASQCRARPISDFVPIPITITVTDNPDLSSRYSKEIASSLRHIWPFYLRGSRYLYLYPSRNVQSYFYFYLSAYDDYFDQLSLSGIWNRSIFPVQQPQMIVLGPFCCEVTKIADISNLRWPIPIILLKCDTDDRSGSDEA